MKTAVEFLEELLTLSFGDDIKPLRGFFVIAKEMEKEQMMNIADNTRLLKTAVMVSADLVNKIHNENCLDTMAKMPDCFVDLTVTSPPYDGLRSYNGYSFLFEEIAKELYRVTKQGGVVVWVVNDSTKNGCESLTSFKQAIYFVECGFNLHDTMIFKKQNPTPNKSNRYTPCYEFMFVLSKGKPKTFNPILVDCIHAGKKASRTVIHKNGERVHQSLKGVYSEKKPKENIFEYVVGTLKERMWKHPAKFPEQLAQDHILSWTNEGDLVYDCFMGSGTTAKMSILNNRNYIGSEMSEEYCNIIEERIKIDKGLFENES